MEPCRQQNKRFSSTSIFSARTFFLTTTALLPAHSLALPGHTRQLNRPVCDKYSDIQIYSDTNICLYHICIQMCSVFVRIRFVMQIYSDIHLYQYKCHTLEQMLGRGNFGLSVFRHLVFNGFENIIILNQNSVWESFGLFLKVKCCTCLP